MHRMRVHSTNLQLANEPSVHRNWAVAFASVRRSHPSIRLRSNVPDRVPRTATSIFPPWPLTLFFPSTPLAFLMQLGALPDYEMSHPSSHLPLSPSTNALDPFFRNASTPAAAQAALAASSSSSDPAGSNHLIPLPPLLPKASSSSSQFPPLQQIGTDRSGRDAYPIQWSSEGPSSSVSTGFVRRAWP